MNHIQELQQRKADLEAYQRLHTRVRRRIILPTLDEVKAASWICFVRDTANKMLACSKGYLELFGEQDYERSTVHSLFEACEVMLFVENDQFVIQTQCAANVLEAWWNPKEQCYQQGEVDKQPYYSDGKLIGIIGRIPRESVRSISEVEYKKVLADEFP